MKVKKSLLDYTCSSSLPSPVPYMTIQALHILRDLYFVSARLGGSSFSQYSFVYLSAIDIISQCPIQAEAYLRDIRPKLKEEIANHPLDRCQDLYFLNISEHFAGHLSPQFDETVLLEAAMPYLGVGGDNRLLELFEAAHSVILAVISAPQNIKLLSRHLHPYLESLFAVFPQTISARQFRFAIRTLVRITSPPASISQLGSLLPSSILELVRSRLENASTDLVPVQKDDFLSITSEHLSSALQTQTPLSERAVLVLSLIDSLPCLPLEQLEDMLPVIANTIQSVQDQGQISVCRQRFWDVLSRGEMDVLRSSLCLSWWGTHGGERLVMAGHPPEPRMEGPFMSGALEE